MGDEGAEQTADEYSRITRCRKSPRPLSGVWIWQNLSLRIESRNPSEHKQGFSEHGSLQQLLEMWLTVKYFRMPRALPLFCCCWGARACWGNSISWEWWSSQTSPPPNELQSCPHPEVMYQVFHTGLLWVTGHRQEEHALDVAVCINQGPLWWNGSCVLVGLGLCLRPFPQLDTVQSSP